MDHNQTFIESVSGKGNIVLLGETGSGKSEIALNLARNLAEAGREVDLFDLDQSKPLLRSRDAEAALGRRDLIHIHYAEQLLDTPIIPGGVLPSLRDPDRATILDVGGGETSARMIGRLARVLEETYARILYLINPYRPWSEKAEDITATRNAICQATRISRFCFIANPNLGAGTCAEEFNSGLLLAQALLPAGEQIQGACLMKHLVADPEGTDLPLLELTLFLQPHDQLCM